MSLPVICPHSAEERKAAMRAGQCPMCLATELHRWRVLARTCGARLATVRHLAAAKPGRFPASIVAVCDGAEPRAASRPSDSPPFCTAAIEAATKVLAAQEPPPSNPKLDLRRLAQQAGLWGKHGNVNMNDDVLIVTHNDWPELERFAALVRAADVAAACRSCGGTGRHVRGHGQEWTCEVCHGTGRAPP